MRKLNIILLLAGIDSQVVKNDTSENQNRLQSYY
jgi:hypothetical protein